MTLLGENSPVPEHYAPEILHPIARAEGRRQLALPAEWYGEDVWHGWELSWLDEAGKPCSAVARFVFPATTDNLVESKSFKLYLNSLNQLQCASVNALREILGRDLSEAAGGPVEVEVLPLDSPLLAPAPMPGYCVDCEVIDAPADSPSPGLLRVEPAAGGKQVLHSHVLRSLCPVTAQPDWATVILRCEHGHVDPASFLAYVTSFRCHQDFHEQCVERMFCDLLAAGLECFGVQALYTRRGGLDISPWRSTQAGHAPRLRSLRQ